MAAPDTPSLNDDSHNPTDLPGGPTADNPTTECQKLFETVPQSRLLSWAKIAHDEAANEPIAKPPLIGRLFAANIHIGFYPVHPLSSQT